MGRLFGTDGIRGFANRHPMTAEIAVKTGRAVAAQFCGQGGKIIIGKDTRISGDLFEHALIAGICSMGTDVYLTGIIPTPGIAWLAASMEDVDAGIVISASHNPFHDNGIKLFQGDGFKLDDETEAAVEEIILDADHAALTENIEKTGKVILLENASEKYISFLKETAEKTGGLNGIKAVIDCSNGAASSIAPELFRSLGAEIQVISNTPDGLNINKNCGSEHIDDMVRLVKESDADIGLAFDGDADRLIAVDEAGNPVTGDQIIAICADFAKENGRLNNETVVTTVMSNMGLVSAFEEKNIRHIMAGVGDRKVMIEMKKAGAVIGGEDSGHMIFLDSHTTGDGLLSALKLLEVIRETGKRLSELSKVMTIFPQKLVNVEVNSKPEIETVPEISEAIRKAEKELDGKGRVLVRYSGTQPMCRVMVEAETNEDTEKYCSQIAEVVKDVLGG